jgi:hypothetical protein
MIPLRSHSSEQRRKMRSMEIFSRSLSFSFLFSLAVLFIFKHSTRRRKKNAKMMKEKIICEEVKHEKGMNLHLG